MRLQALDQQQRTRRRLVVLDADEPLEHRKQAPDTRQDARVGDERVQRSDLGHEAAERRGVST